jgi:tetratricopeptide (TPR) repeat protein
MVAPSAPRRLLVILLLIAPATAPQKRKRQRATVPTLPADLQGDDGDIRCPFHRAPSEATPQELSWFGHELERDGRRPEAMRCYAAAVRAYPKSALAWFDLSVAQDDDPALALRLYAHGVSLEPTSFHYNQLGVMLRVRERHTEAADHFRIAAKLAPTDADPLFNLGGTHEQLENYAAALDAYRGALELEHKNEARIQNNIASVLGKLERWNEALRAYAEAEEADADFPETQLNLARIHKMRGEYKEAIARFRRAAKLHPADAANLTAEAAELETKLEEQRVAMRQAARREEVNKRDGHLSREQRIQRFQEVIGVCGGTDQACMKKVLGQDDGDPDDLVVL